MSVLEILILAVGLSMDAFAVSICKGLAVKRIDMGKAGIVGLWFGGFQALMPMIGYFLGSRFSNAIQSVDHWVAFILLSLIGANMYGRHSQGTRTRAGTAARCPSRPC